MNFRVTPRLAVDFATSELARQTTELQRTQEQVSTGLRLHRPSDDPAAMRRSIVQKDQLLRLQTNLESVDHVKARVSQSHVQLREAQQLFVRARSAALSVTQATEDAEIDALAAELDGILEQMVSLANSSDESGYLFGGTATESQPFTVERAFGKITSVAYSGASADSRLHVTGDVSRQALVAGDQAFNAPAREDTIVLGTTGIVSGSFTDAASGSLTMTVAHTLTTFAAGSGIAAGTSSVAGDNIVGAAGVHQLQITDSSGTGSFGTVSLNGGAAISFTSTDTDLQVPGPNGEVVHLDMTAITAGFNGTVDITADGTMSPDNGVTTQPLTFADNQLLLDPADGAEVYMDTTGARLTGTAHVEFPGTTSAFDVLIELRDDILNSRGLNNADRFAAIDRRLGDIERVENHLLNEVGVQSVSLEQMERLKVRTEDLALDQELKYSETTAADIAVAAVRLQELLTLQQFTMASVSKLLSQNLLQFLQ